MTSAVLINGRKAAINGKGKIVRGIQVTIICEREGCNNERLTRISEMKRGSGRFCSKRCSSLHREEVKKGRIDGDIVTHLKYKEDLDKMPKGLNVKIGK